MSEDVDGGWPTGAGDPVLLSSGDRVTIRPLRRRDGPGLVAMVDGLSAESRYRRFHTGLPHLTHAMVDYLTAIDHHDHEAMVAITPGSAELIGVARFVRDKQRVDAAELAVVVADAWQRRGVATALLTALAQRAAELGISEFTADVQTTNGPTFGLIDQFDKDAEIAWDGSTANAHVHNLAWRPAAEPTGRSVLRRFAAIASPGEGAAGEPGVGRATSA
ncbi:GNAT family N-acetyltransferase [Pseudonocardia sp. GCM10023141]|uniref:GNAT family N-acetyltransferase n=1 Tax=Pseudonocardia sp. GCM10023141 TaxID=3252653 RepID=UPI00361870C9